METHGKVATEEKTKNIGLRCSVGWHRWQIEERPLDNQPFKHLTLVRETRRCGRCGTWNPRDLKDQELIESLARTSKRRMARLEREMESFVQDCDFGATIRPVPAEECFAMRLVDQDRAESGNKSGGPSADVESAKP